MPRRIALVPLLLMLGLLLLLAGPAGQVGAATPTMGPSATPANTRGGYFRWTGELMTANASTTSLNLAANIASTSVCTDNGGNVAAVVTTASATQEYVILVAASTVGLADTWTSRTVALADTNLVYYVLNPYYEIPSDVINAFAVMTSSSGAGKMVITDYADPYRTNLTINLIIIRGYVTTAGTLTIHSLNLLCYYPFLPTTPTSTPTFTLTPIPTLSPSLTSTPPVRQEITLPSGGSLQLNRAISYGDVAVVSSVIGLIAVILFSLWFLVPKLRAK